MAYTKNWLKAGCRRQYSDKIAFLPADAVQTSAAAITIEEFSPDRSGYPVTNQPVGP
jgi:hypothetical protein